jgi:hypothetical protein
LAGSRRDGYPPLISVQAVYGKTVGRNNDQRPKNIDIGVKNGYL